MNDYIQPKFYHFTQDSIFLAKTVADDSQTSRPKNILDLCAGCGVVGLEVIQGSNYLESACAVEYQLQYMPFLETNYKQFAPYINSKLICSSVGKMVLEEKFDCIVANPPYFKMGSGRKSAEVNRQVSRTFEVDNLDILLRQIKKAKSLRGKAYVVFPSHDIDAKKLFKLFGYFEFQQAGVVTVYRLA